MRREALAGSGHGIGSTARRAGEAVRLLVAVPRHLGGMASTAGLLARDWRCGDLPQSADALQDPEGLCGFLADVTPARLGEAFARGLSPWASLGVVSLWSPARQWALALDDSHLPTRLRHDFDAGAYRVRIDCDADEVLGAWQRSPAGSAAPRRLIEAYRGLFEARSAHGYSVLRADGTLCAFGFGVGSGAVFRLEGRSAKLCPASRTGLFAFAHALSHAGYWLIANGMWQRPDSCEGFRAISRAELASAVSLRADRPLRAGETDARDVCGWWPAGH
jgi:leucyl/phenylalanyl-tRNA--protein transferase